MVPHWRWTLFPNSVIITFFWNIDVTTSDWLFIWAVWLFLNFFMLWQMEVSSWAVCPSQMKLLILTSSNFFTIFYGYLWKQQVAASLWAACGFLATSGGLFMSSLCALIFFEDSKWRSLHEQLVCYWHLWKEASGGLFIWAACVSPTIMSTHQMASLWKSPVGKFAFYHSFSSHSADVNHLFSSHSADVNHFVFQPQCWCKSFLFPVTVLM